MTFVLSQFAKAKLALLLIVACLVWGSPVKGADALVYTDSLASGWSDTSYGTTRNYCTSPAVQGSCALSVQFQSAWAGWQVTSSGLNASPHNAISFFIKRTFTAAVPEAYLTFFGVNSVRLGSVLINAYIPGGLINTTWSKIEIPLVDLGITPSQSVVTKIDIESNVSDTMQFDDMRFTTLTIPNQSTLYKDALPFGWRDTSYGSFAGNRVFNSSVSMSGAGIQMYHPYPWTGFSLSNSFGVDTRGKNVLSFAVNGGSTGGQDLYVVLGSATNPSLGIQPVLSYIPGNNMQPNRWYTVNIPLSDLGGVNKVVNRISIESATSTIVYYDNIVIGYQDPFAFFNTGVGGNWKAEVYGGNADYNAIIGGRIPYDDNRGLQVNYTMPWGGLYISDWRSGGGVNTTNKHNLVLSVNGGSIGGQDVYLSLYGANPSQTIGTVRLNNYLFHPITNIQFPAGTPLAPNIWYDVVVPLSALNATNTLVKRIGIECDRISSVWFDDIRIGGFLRFPLLSVNNPNDPNPTDPFAGYTPERSPINSVMDHNILGGVTAYTGEIADGSSQGGQNPCYNRSGRQQEFAVNGNYTGGGCINDKTYLSYEGHEGIDYRASTGSAVFAAAAGAVSFTQCDQTPCTGLGIITINHDGGYSTRYLHLQSAYGGLTKDTVVKAGDRIGTSGSTGTGAPHLHFELLKDSIPIDPYGWQGQGSFADPYTAAPSTVRLWR